LLAGNVLVIFPINVFVCFFCGALLVIFQHEEAVRARETEAIRAMEPQPQMISTPVRVIHRFTRSGKLPA
jgi:hypothetical protein